MSMKTAVIQHVPTEFTPADPRLYQAMLQRTPAGADVSIYWSTQWANYVGDDHNRVRHTQAKEMRWFAREWRARNAGKAGQPTPWVSRPITPVEPARVKKRRGEVVIPPSQAAAPLARKRGRHAPELSAQQIADKQAAEANRQERRARELLFVAAYQELGSVRLVAARFGVNDRTVGRALDNHRIPRIQPPKPPMEIPEDFVALYESGASYAAMGKALGMSSTAIARRAARLVGEGRVQERGD